MSQQINLFNPIFRKQRKIFTSVTMLRALGVLLLGTMAVALVGQRSVAQLQQQATLGAERLQQKQAKLVTVNTDFAPRQKSAALAEDLAQAEARVVALRGVAATLAKGDMVNTQGYAEYFRALARQNPDGVWLTGVMIHGDGDEVAVQGKALDAALVPTYLTRLGREKIMQGKTFGSLDIAQPKLEASKEEASAAPPPYVEFTVQTNTAEAAK